MASETITLLSITANPEFEKNSFEEIRVKDYIKSYQDTGHPPAPCPQEPKDANQRAALNLPPLFLGYVTTPSAGVTVKRITNPIDIPPAQEFHVNNVAGEKYQSMSCMEEYMDFSHEELRYWAYYHGHKEAPTPVTLAPFITPTIAAKDPVVGTSNEQFQCISAQPEYNKHSPEELRIAFLLHHRQLTSAELIQLENPSASMSAAPISVWSAPSSSLTATPTAIPPPVYASTGPKFTFGLR